MLVRHGGKNSRCVLGTARYGSLKNDTTCKEVRRRGMRWKEEEEEETEKEEEEEWSEVER